MAAAQFSTAVQSILSLFVLIFILAVWWPHQRIDVFRQQMFALRDEFFDFALDGNIAFDDPAYRQLRDLMNGLIRFAHNLTPFRTVFLLARWKYSPPPGQSFTWSVEWERTLEKVESNDTREKLREFHSRLTMLMMSLLVLSPGLILTITPFLVIGIVLYAPWATLRDIYRFVADRIPVALLEQEAANS